MIISLQLESIHYQADLSKPLDISLPLRAGAGNPSCYYAEPVLMKTIVSGDFVGSVQRGGSVNYQKITITPHGNGTHTECYGHITADESATVNSLLSSFHFISEVISLSPETLQGGDRVVTLRSFKEKQQHKNSKAIIIRTLPNDTSKKDRQYSGTNPPYLEAELANYLVAQGVDHLLLDLPSVDKEVDGGKLAGHKAFWQMNGVVRKHCTITELIYVPDAIADGLYLLSLQIAPFEMDASPSKPVLYKLTDFLP